MRIASRIVVGLLVSQLMACAADVGSGENSSEPSAGESTAKSAEPVILTRCDGGIGTPYDSCSELVDASGTITTRTYKCKLTGDFFGHAASSITATCPVEAGFVLVGGGAQVDLESGAQPGALVTASYPDAGLTTWTAKTKDHVELYPHRTRAYAIGLKLAGVSEAALRASAHYLMSTNASNVNHPVTSVAETNSGYLVVGGGAKANYSGAGQLLWDTRYFTSATEPNGGWTASSKDHWTADPGKVTAYAISIPRCPSGYSGGCLQTSSRDWNSQQAYGYEGASIPASSTWLATSVGALARSSCSFGPCAGRLIADLYPVIDQNFGGMTAWTKDHHVAEEGYTTARLLMIARR